MRRREFITLVGGATVAWPVAARAQQPIIGYLGGRSLRSDEHLVTAFRESLKTAGYTEGRNVLIEYRWADGQNDRLVELAADLVRNKVSVLFAGGIDNRIRAIKAAVTTTPAVFATAGDLVDLGIVRSVNRPGSNITGVTILASELWTKELSLLRELLGPTQLVALLVNPTNETAKTSIRDAQAAARTINQGITIVNATTEREFDSAFAALIQQRAGAVLVAVDALFINRRDKIVSLAAAHSVPAIFGRREFAAAGGLMSYGASAIEQYRQCAVYVGRILGGAKPADLPILYPTKFELVINRKTAKALGLTIPDKLLALADEVID